MTGKCVTAFKLMLTLLCLLMLDIPTTALAADSSDSALAFVRQNHLGDGLPWLGYQVASRTTTFSAIVQKVGKVQAQTIVQDELQRLQPTYQEQWTRNMAQAYSESFSAAEMRQLVIGNPPKPLADKFKSAQNDVSMSMKAKSEDLLKTYVSKALLNAMTKISR
ncbi:hypothetical protein [Pseudomonas sp. NA-150]|uniref:hypothetical protein n=1 Tax=Pseudomonas sp. NA-150 TaxID=3367525 RepID=UPI0037C58F1D